MEKKKVIIIGAGPAGLTAAWELLKEPERFEVMILEESQEIGGISRTVKYEGKRMDIGGHRFFTKVNRVRNLWTEIMPLQGKPSKDDAKLGREKKLMENGPDPEKEDNVLLIRNRVSRIYYLKKFFDYPVTLKKETFINMGFTKTVKSGVSYIKSAIWKRKEESLEDFYVNRFGKQLYSMFFEGYTEKLWGRHPSEIAADWGAQRVKGLSITAVIKDMFTKALGKKNKQVETSLIEEFWYPKLGPGQLWETLAKKIQEKGGIILKGHQVTKIHLGENKIEAVSCKVGEESKTFTGDIFLSSMPIKDLVLNMQDKAVAENIKHIAEGLPYRDFITVGLLLSKLNLENKTNIKTLGNIVPDCWIYIQDTGVRLRTFANI